MDEKITTQVQPFLDLIAGKQDTYFKENGKYWQGLKTVDIIPEVTALSVSKVIEKIDVAPEGKTDTWKSIGLDKLELPFEAEVHEYQAPNNEFGYQVILRIIKDGKEWRYSKGYGIESDVRTWDWREIIKPNENGTH